MCVCVYTHEVKEYSSVCPLNPRKVSGNDWLRGIDPDRESPQYLLFALLTDNVFPAFSSMVDFLIIWPPSHTLFSLF